MVEFIVAGTENLFAENSPNHFSLSLSLFQKPSLLMIAQAWQAEICWKIDTLVSRIRIITQNAFKSKIPFTSSLVYPTIQIFRLRL